MAKRKDKDRSRRPADKARNDAARAEAPASKSGPAADAPVPTEATLRPVTPAPRWLVIAAFAAYVVWMGVLIWLAAQPAPPEPFPAKVIVASPVIVTGTRSDGRLAVEAVLKGDPALAGRTVPLSGPLPDAPAEGTRIYFLESDLREPPEGPGFRIARVAADERASGRPAEPLLLAQIQAVVEAEAARGSRR